MSDLLTGVVVLAMSPSQEGVWLHKVVESNQVGLTAVFALSPLLPLISPLSCQKSWLQMPKKHSF